jgi:hypothetical protein
MTYLLLNIAKNMAILATADSACQNEGKLVAKYYQNTTILGLISCSFTKNLHFFNILVFNYLVSFLPRENTTFLAMKNDHLQLVN